MKNYDVVIIGAGLGGMLCGAILAKEGMRIAIVEQNKQTGGCLQTFSFQKKIFDSCVHYIGAMEEGQTQKRIFDFAGITNELKLRQLDKDGYDKIVFDNDNNEYPHAQGLKNFTQQLSKYFPEERHALNNYVESLQFTGDCFPLYNLKNGTGEEKNKVSGWELQQTINGITKNNLLKSVLLGNNLLYAGERNTTPFYIHSLISKSYIDSSYKCEGGSSQISKALTKRIREYGGEIYRNEKVILLKEENNVVAYLETESGRRIAGKHFIANIHPAQLLNILQTDKIKPAYKNRIQSVHNGASAFLVNVVLRPKTVAHRNYNIYWHKNRDVFSAVESRNQKTIESYALYFTEDKSNPGYADTVAILLYADIAETAIWKSTHNRTAAPSNRCDEYENFKHQKSEQVITEVGHRFPDITNNIQSYSAATPLTFRDYMGTSDGSMYGMMTDVNFPEASRIPVRTKVSNLLLTGQNVNLHGVLGVSITAIATCGELLGLDYLLKKL